MHKYMYCYFQLPEGSVSVSQGVFIDAVILANK